MCHPHPLFQGTMDNKVVTTVTRAAAELGLPTLRFNFRGVGKSEGEHDNGRGEQQDVLSVIKYAKEQLRSEEHTSELQSRPHLVCRLLLEKKKIKKHKNKTIL